MVACKRNLFHLLLLFDNSFREVGKTRPQLKPRLYPPKSPKLTPTTLFTTLVLKTVSILKLTRKTVFKVAALKDSFISIVSKITLLFNSSTNLEVDVI